MRPFDRLSALCIAFLAAGGFAAAHAAEPEAVPPAPTIPAPEPAVARPQAVAEPSAEAAPQQPAVAQPLEGGAEADAAAEVANPGAPAVAPLADPATAEPEDFRPKEPVAVRSTFFPPDRSWRDGPSLSDSELARHDARDPYKSARVHLEAGRASEALKLLGRGRTLAERYLRAEALSAAGQRTNAAKAFEALAGEYPPLADRCALRAGEEYEETGSWQPAAAQYERVPQWSLGYVKARQGLARALRRSGDLRGALSILKAAAADAGALRWRDAADALFEAAEIEHLLGEKKAAASDYLAIWSERPASPVAPQALERARSLGAEPTSEQRLRRGELLVDLGANRMAVQTLRPLVEVAPGGFGAELDCRARVALGRAFRKLRRHGQAIAILRTAVERCEAGGDSWARALYVAGSSAAAAGTGEAVELFEMLAHEAPEHALADDGLLMMAEALEGEGRLPAARIALRRLALSHPGGDSTPEGLFRLFWIERAEGRVALALAALERLARIDAPEAFDRALYWKGRTLLELGRDEEALGAWEQLVLRKPASFYATLARSRLAERVPERAAALAERLAVGPVPARPLELGPLGEDPHLKAGLELARLGQGEQAAEELLAIERRSLPADERAETVRVIVLLLSRAGQARLAHAVARTELKAELERGFTPEELELWRAAYPLEFRELVEKQAGEAAIDPDLLQALIREESALDPKIQSWAGAVGLAQLMLPTAREVARSLKIPGPITRERLHDPELNLRLGATYLSRLIKQFKGNVALSLAGYNAGPGAVRGWVTRTEWRYLDEFVENIPVRETREYVKRVLKSYAAYQLVYGRAARPAQLPPELVASRR